MSAEEYESWKETRAIQKNPALMEDIRRGLHQFEKGQRFSFEEVFGEPLKKSKRKK